MGSSVSERSSKLTLALPAQELLRDPHQIDLFVSYSVKLFKRFSHLNSQYAFLNLRSDIQIVLKVIERPFISHFLQSFPNDISNALSFFLSIYLLSLSLSLSIYLSISLTPSLSPLLLMMLTCLSVHSHDFLPNLYLYSIESETLNKMIKNQENCITRLQHMLKPCAYIFLSRRFFLRVVLLYEKICPTVIFRKRLYSVKNHLDYLKYFYRNISQFCSMDLHLKV